MIINLADVKEEKKFYESLPGGDIEISYERLFTRSGKTPFFRVKINGNYAPEVVTEKYTPIMITPILKRVESILKDKIRSYKVVQKSSELMIMYIVDEELEVGKVKESEAEFYGSKLNTDLVSPVFFVSNSYDGSVPFLAGWGLYRYVCSNGLIVPYENDRYNTSFFTKHIAVSEEKFEEFLSNTFVSIEVLLSKLQKSKEEKIDFEEALKKFDPFVSKKFVEEYSEKVNVETGYDFIQLITADVSSRVWSGRIRPSNLIKAGRRLAEVL